MSPPSSSSSSSSKSSSSSSSSPSSSSSSSSSSVESSAPPVPPVVDPLLHSDRKFIPSHSLTRRPCFRNSLLFAMGVGGVTGVLGAVLRMPVIKACNLAVLSFAASASVCWPLCNYQEQKRTRLVAQIMHENMNSKEEHTRDAEPPSK